MTVTVKTTVAAPIDIVWRAYSTPADIVQWNAASDDWHTTRQPTVRVRVSLDPESTFPIEYQRAGWQAILDNFARHVAAC